MHVRRVKFTTSQNESIQMKVNIRESGGLKKQIILRVYISEGI